MAIIAIFMAMKLLDWRKLTKKTLQDVAEGLGVAGGARTIQRIETGQVDPDADMAARIHDFTGGAVTPLDLHEARLAWLKDNRPERFAAPAEEAAR